MNSSNPLLKKKSRKHIHRKMGSCVLEVNDVSKTFFSGQHNEVRALIDVNFKVKSGEFVTIMGPSGSGKTTLLDILGCLLKPTNGKVIIDERDTSKMNEDQLAGIRRKKIGFVFQQYNLISTLTSLENVLFALRIGGKSNKESLNRAKELLKMVGLEKRMTHRTSLLSSGEAQRVSIARALANDPSIVLADEPTGNLDSETSKKILNFMEWLNLEKGYTFLVVTHDPEITKYSNRIIYLKDGTIIKEIIKHDHKIVKL